jgi:DNA-binding XRE family transcriptional regulator
VWNRQDLNFIGLFVQLGKAWAEQMQKKFGEVSPRDRAIAERFRQAREDAGITQQRVGLHIGVSRDQVASIEAERVALRFRPGWRFCIELDINAHWLARGEEPYRPCVDYFKVYSMFEPIENDPDILFSDGYDKIEARYQQLFEESSYRKRGAGELRKLARPIHGHTSSPHEETLRILATHWLRGVAPNQREALMSHLMDAAEQFKKKRKLRHEESDTSGPNSGRKRKSNI